MQKKIAVIFIFLILSALTTTVFAQGGGPGPGNRMYDPKTEVTLTGSVEDVLQQQACMGRGRNGTHLMVKTESETVEVCLGPAGFVQQKGFSFAKGDQVELIGSRVKLGEKDVVIARQVTKNKQTLVLRDAQGIPAWAGGRRSFNR